VVRILLGHSNVDANRARTDNGCTPLFLACQQGHAAVVRMLLEAGARADLAAALEGHTTTCMEIAQHQGHAEVVALLAGAVVVPGARVLVHGLQSAAGQALNGQRGAVVGAFDAKAGRWAVQLDGDGGRGSDGENNRPKLLKPANLRRDGAS
jgi:hypothetical protein